MDYLGEALKIILATAVAIIAFYFKKETDRSADKEKELEQEIKQVTTKLYDFKREAQKEFVTKDEFIRSISGLDKKLDKIMDEIIRLKK